MKNTKNHEKIVLDWIAAEEAIKREQEAQIAAEKQAQRDALETVKKWIEFETKNPDQTFTPGEPGAEEVSVNKIIF